MISTKNLRGRGIVVVEGKPIFLGNIFVTNNIVDALKIML
jgi:hypothetical protein